MRKGHVMKIFRSAFCLLSAVSCLLAAVDGVVMNGTTGKPQPATIVSLLQPGQGGLQTLASVRSDAEGKFRIDKDYPPGPALLQALHQGATYTLILPPGGPTSGVRVNVYNATTDPATVKTIQRLVLIEPSASALQISEAVICQNDTQTTFQDPVNGSVQFYLPEAAGGKAQVTINAPGGMPIQRPAEKTKQADVYKVDYPLRPGETRFDVAYSLPPSETFSGRILRPGELTRLATPPSVTLSGDGLQSLGQEPQSQVRLYGVSGNKYEVKIEGFGSLRGAGGAGGGGGGQDEDDGQPRVDEAQARLYSRLWLVLGLVFGILGVGGVMLYRRGPA
jgi:hypothetical protein